ncbi:HBAP1 protein, partial [Atractosteus spatula]|nr:HBAP1 protein [Atractosteus spatula]
MGAKPFTPEEARRIVEALRQPAVFCNMASDWPGLQWNVDYLSRVLESQPIKFRLGKRQERNVPLFETQCSYTEAKLQDFVAWTRGQTASPSEPFSDYLLSEYWAYADYKYIAMLFADKASMFEDIKWEDFGFPGRDARDSTLWIGTQGANTPCHLDSYGCNLVLQVQGRKRWHLFPPEDTHCLYPTRIPYEESSVFSKVNVVNPDCSQFPAFGHAKPRVVTLKPGQVLFVPRHWWHYVESIDPITVSINSWIEMDIDDEARVGEALTKTIVCALKSAGGPDNGDVWLNPTEAEVSSHEENLLYLNLAVQSCLDKQKCQCNKSTAFKSGTAIRLGKRDFRGQAKRTEPAEEGADSHEPAEISTVPFGPNLVAVPLKLDEQAPQCQAGGAQDSRHHVCAPSSPRSQLSCGFCEEHSCPRKPERGEAEVTTVSNKKHTDGSHRFSPISTNELLDSLVHPEVIALVTKILMDKQNAV